MIRRKIFNWLTEGRIIISETKSESFIEIPHESYFFKRKEVTNGHK